MRVAVTALVLVLAACDDHPKVSAMSEEAERNWFEENEEVQAWIPYDESEGLRFKYWSGSGSESTKSSTIESFSLRHGVTIPGDFVDIVGDVCEGGFDGSYRVAMDEGNRIGWWRLCSFADPTRTTAEHREDVGEENFVDRILTTHPDLFTSADGTLRFLPFGRGDRFGPTDHGTSGFLAFDFEGRVVFLAAELDAPIPIAASFREMLAQSVFMHYG